MSYRADLAHAESVSYTMKVSDEPFRLVTSAEAWQAAARRGPGLAQACQELFAFAPWRRIEAVGQFVGGGLHRHGYGTLRNGGAPLFLRRRRGWTSEILLRPYGRGSGTPATVDLHVSSERLAAVRRRYWRSSSQGVAHVASVNLGRLVTVGAHGALFDLSAPEAGPMILGLLEDVGLLWLDRTSNPGDWEDDADGLLDCRTTLELLLAYGGWGRAGRYLQARLAANPELRSAVERSLSDVESGRLSSAPPPGVGAARLPHAIAAIASTYGLL